MPVRCFQLADGLTVPARGLHHTTLFILVLYRTCIVPGQVHLMPLYG